MINIIYNGMKILKFYEDLTDDMKVGDYALMKIVDRNSFIPSDNVFYKYINTTIGKICNIRKYNGINILYENVPDDIKGYFGNSDGLYERNFKFSEIVEYGRTIEELKMKLETNKFNI